MTPAPEHTPRQVHVAPLPPGHVDRGDCPCLPIRSAMSDDAGELWIHRTAPPEPLVPLHEGWI